MIGFDDDRDPSKTFNPLTWTVMPVVRALSLNAFASLEVLKLGWVEDEAMVELGRIMQSQQEEGRPDFCAQLRVLDIYWPEGVVRPSLQGAREIIDALAQGACPRLECLRLMSSEFLDDLLIHLVWVMASSVERSESGREWSHGTD